MTEKPMSRAELSETLNALMGGSPRPTEPPCRLPNHLPYVSITKGEWDYHYDGQHWPGEWRLAKDPTCDIAAAWALKEWFFHPARYGDNHVLEERCADEKKLFIGEWRTTTLWRMTQQELALWICRTVYWAVEGTRVVLIGEDDAETTT